MNVLLQQLSIAVESGKINKACPFPPSMKGMDGADELCQQALEAGIKAEIILNDCPDSGLWHVSDRNSRKDELLCQKC